MLQSQKQALRLRRAVISNLGLLMCIPLFTLAAYFGYASVENLTLLLYVTSMWAGHLFFVAFHFIKLELTIQRCQFDYVTNDLVHNRY